MDTNTAGAPLVGADHIAIVINNNQPGWTNIVETAPNVTLDVGTKLYLAPAPTSRFPDIHLADGEVYAGVSRDHDTGAWHHLVLLPAESPDVNWKAAHEWAKSVGGDLPTRFEAALLYANLRDKVDQDYWYWTATPYADAERSAWDQLFHGGGQGSNPKVSTSRARAVRRVPV